MRMFLNILEYTLCVMHLLIEYFIVYLRKKILLHIVQLFILFSKCNNNLTMALYLTGSINIPIFSIAE